MTEVQQIVATLAGSPRFVAAMLIRKQARATGSPVGDLSLREIAVQLGMRAVLADGPRVDVQP